MKKVKFGLIPDQSDDRDFKFIPLPFMDFAKEVDLSFTNPYVYDQAKWGSCVFNALGSLFKGRLRRQGQDFIPSRFFPYYLYRQSINKVNEDTGASIREAIKIYVDKGVCKEDIWPYVDDNFSKAPSKIAFDDALLHQAIVYRSVSQDYNSLKACLNQADTFVCGIAIYESFMTGEVTKTGIIPMPKAKEKLLGWHAIEGVGYFDNDDWYMKNSWGKKWGINGYFRVPIDYLLSPAIASFFWTITMVEINN